MKCPCENTKRSMPKCDAGTPPVIEINGGECPVLFHTVNIPASVGTVETMPPTPGAYRNARVFYEADNIAYLYDSDGIPQLLSMPGEGGGAVESVNGQTGVVVLDANDVGAATPADLAAKQDILTAGTNIQISGNTISATDTTYSNFVGTDGVDAGSAGLVPAPGTADAGKFLKADGTWGAAGGTLYTTYGTNEDGAMTQKATTDLVYTSADPKKINIGDNGITGGTNTIIIGSEDSGTITSASDQIIIGHDVTDYGANSIAIGHTAKVNPESVALGDNASATGGGSGGNSGSVAIGRKTTASGNGAIAIGNGSGTASGAVASGSGGVSIGHSTASGKWAVCISQGDSTYDNGSASAEAAVSIGAFATCTKKQSVALGSYANPRVQGVVDVSTGVYAEGYQGTNDGTRTQYRVISGIHDPEQDHDAATKGYVDSIYPIGSVFQSTSSTAPTIAGGTWTNIGTQTIGSSTIYYYERTA